MDEQRRLHLCDVIVLAEYRNRGYGTAGLQLLCRAAKEAGIAVLYDEIAADNPSLGLFLKNGFAEVGRTGGAVIVKIVLSEFDEDSSVLIETKGKRGLEVKDS